MKFPEQNDTYEQCKKKKPDNKSYKFTPITPPIPCGK